VGQDAVIEQAVIAVLAGGHVLLEGVPGTAKTLLVRCLARVVGQVFRRIQLTPDLMPSDILGVSVFDASKSQFEFRPGPIFANFVLADEINRAPAKTQAALLEGMEEHQVTVDGRSYLLPAPFAVFATQNPVEHEGTYALPEAQLDRFLFKSVVDYPERQSEDAMLQLHDQGFDPNNIESLGLQTAVTPEDLVACRSEIGAVRVEPAVRGYILDIVRSTRRAPFILLGASPRAAAVLLLASKATAAVRGRGFVIPDDVKEMARPVLRHRVILQPEAEVDGMTPDAAVAAVIESRPVPR
jgi:MoxR-like ATPase